MDKDMMKRNDDELENVSGGSWKETLQLRGLFREGDNEYIKLRLMQLGIEATIHEDGSWSNHYKDMATGKSLMHEEVIKRLEEIKFLH